MDKKIALALAFLPLVAFFAAGISEIRAEGRLTLRIVPRLLPAVAGIAAFYLFWNPDLLGPVTPDRSEMLSRAMTVVCAVIACSGVFIRYSDRRSGIWMALGGLMLMFMWMVNRAYY